MEKSCKACGQPIGSDEVTFCPFCGQRQEDDQDRPAASGVSASRLLVLAAVVAAGLTLTGTFLPWGEAQVAFIGRVTIDGAGGGYHAEWIRYLALCAAVIAASAVSGRGLWLSGLGVALVGLLMLYWSIDDVRRLSDVEQRINGSLVGPFVSPSAGTGLVLSTTGSGFVVICGVAGAGAEIARRRRAGRRA